MGDTNVHLNPDVIKDDSIKVSKLSKSTQTVLEKVNTFVDEYMDIPKIFWTGSLPETKAEGAYKGKVRWESINDKFSCFGTLKVQGNSSTVYPKKNYTITFYSDEACETKKKKEFKDWGKESKYVLKANWIDLTHARNIVSCRIWANMVKTRDEYESYPEDFHKSPNCGVIDGFPVKLYVNGRYWGRYSFNIPKDGWMCHMSKSNQEQVILCSENYIGGCFRAAPVINGTDWTDEVHDEVPQTIMDSWSDAVDFVMNSTDEDFKEHLCDYFDVTSLIDYYIFGVLSCNLDGFGKNQIYFKYEETPYIAEIYDLDSTWGLWWNGQSFVTAEYTREQYQDFQDCPLEEKGNLLYIRLASLFEDEISQRWLSLRDNVLSIDELVLQFERWTDICPNDLVKEDYASTTGVGSFTGIPSKQTNNIQQLRKFIVERRDYTDQKLKCEKYFNLVVSSIYAQADDVINVSINTNLPYDEASITVNGDAVYDSSTGTLTIGSDVLENDVITIYAVSEYNSEFTSEVTITIREVAMIYEHNGEFTGNVNDIVFTNFHPFTAENNNWTMFIKAKIYAASGSLRTILGAYNAGNVYDNSLFFTVSQSGSMIGSLKGNSSFGSHNLPSSSTMEYIVGIRRQGNTLYCTTDGTTWYDNADQYGATSTPVSNYELLLGGAVSSSVSENNGKTQPYDGGLICYVYEGQVEDLSNVWDAAFVNNPRYITLNATGTESIVPGGTLQLNVIDTNYRTRLFEWSVTGEASVSSTGLVTINDDAEEGGSVVVTCTAMSTVEQAVPASVSTTITVAAAASETVLKSNWVADNTTWKYELSNGVGDEYDIDFANGDYIDIKGEQREGGGSARIISIGTDISIYNNQLNINKQMTGNTWLIMATWCTNPGGSVQSGFNAGENFYIRLKNDGVYYSLDEGVNFTKVNPNANQEGYNNMLSEISNASTIQVGSQQGERPTGVYYEFIKVVRA